ncbi:hypothetical protein HDU97_009981 [Phlyctochytrium planicorne]|nr:hypothetical protein HDU97_009981 [Phlyctochytrium planicorne]
MTDNNKYNKSSDVTSSHPQPFESNLIFDHAETDFGVFAYRMRLPCPIFDAAKPTIVFIHGLLVDSLVWDQTMEFLPQRGYQCVAPHLPLGCHVHPVKNRDALVFENVAASTLVALKKIGVDKFTVVANDTGGTFHIALLGLLFTTPYIRDLPLLFGWITKKGIDANMAEHHYARMGATSEIQKDIKKILWDVRHEIKMDLALDMHKFQRPNTVVVCSEDTKLHEFTFTCMNRFAEALRKPLDAGEGVAGYAKVKTVDIKDSYAFVMVDQQERLADVIADHMSEHVNL